MTLTILFWDRTRPAEDSTAGLGGATVSAGSAPSAPKTWTYGPLASRLRKSENIVRAPEGITPSTACSTADFCTWVVTMANGALTTADPISHAMSRTEMHADRGPRHGVDQGRRAPVHPGAHRGADRGGEQLADHGGHEHGDDGHQGLLGGPLHQGAGELRREGRAHGRAAQEPGETQDSDDEALAIAGHGECRGERNQDQVKQVTRHQPTV